MKKRIDYYQAAPDVINGIAAASKQVAESFADHKLKALVELRVSQINGCAYCINLHNQEARALGERQQRLDCLSVWREVGFFSDRERAALAWAESVTLIAKGVPSDEIYEEAAKHFNGEELVQLTSVISLMNLWNRISISFGKTPGERKEG
jgi:AhpD family alkylhydroperoxidase